MNVDGMTVAQLTPDYVFFFIIKGLDSRKNRPPPHPFKNVQTKAVVLCGEFEPHYRKAMKGGNFSYSVAPPTSLY